MSNEARAVKRREILGEAKRLYQYRKISSTEYLLLEEIINLSNGRLRACLASCRYLAARLGRTPNHIRKLIRHLEKLNFIKRHYRFRGQTKHHLSNVIEVIGYTRVTKFEWRNSLPNEAGVSALPPIQVNEIIMGLESAMEQLTKHSFSVAQSMIKAWWNSVKSNEVIQKFLSYFQHQLEQQNRRIMNVSAYINKCLNNFSPYNCFFFTSCLDYLKRYQRSEEDQSQEAKADVDTIVASIAQDKAEQAESLRKRIQTLEKAQADIPTNIPPTLAGQMRAKYNKIIQNLRQQLTEIQFA